ncbi:hypothetical protein SAMN04515647_1910 [Cohaesibacter sp. ES.047]|uniref:hypothetical protein n=1 Tax=Cohaesibacter sp. ES.047 TaxID=1798205 RepID=UPI000BBF55DB|nr:hypothetical protein [Cohaesibacter sp. ES.047]SNY91682.1 hypothetical protein SAMN04515647_1910 [Cohaesibacter sp. ES.047]
MSDRIDCALGHTAVPRMSFVAFFAPAKAQGTTYAQIHNGIENKPLTACNTAADADNMAQNAPIDIVSINAPQPVTKKIQTQDDQARALGSSTHIDSSQQLVGLA